jgi:ferredoxin-thioredoxin reductase catalytic chain
LASGRFEIDRDILCPCDYRDPDVLEYGACYCALYVRKDLHEGQTPVEPVPERRPLEKQMRAYKDAQASSSPTPEAATQTESKAVPDVKLKLWYCRQCGYTAFREDPPYVCPICKAKRDMFSEIRISTALQG